MDGFRIGTKLEVAIQELEETKYWFDLLVEGGFVRAKLLTDLRKEADELMAMLVASVQKVKRKRNETKRAAMRPTAK